ncbi:MAG: hypothetical protein M3341_01750, partial [Actinomycetota bacterium]|nr:hypothetical protein [Actinomycetota bacterium]
MTGERVVVRVGTDDSGGELLVADGYLRPGSAVAGEHVHPAIEERFTVVRGRVGFRIDGASRSRSRDSACTCRPGRCTTGGTRAMKRRTSLSRSAPLPGS